MNSSTIVLGTTTAVGSTVYSVNDDGTIDKKKGTSLLGTTLAGTVSTAIQDGISHSKISKIHERATSEYFTSMSDEELVSALEQMGLLEDNVEESHSKTI